MTAHGYGGVNFDFEYIRPQTATVTLHLLPCCGIRSTRSVLQSLSRLRQKPHPTNAVCYEAHDYAQLGQAANNMLIMSYEWGYAHSAPMAVAPLNKVRQVMQYAVSAIPSTRIFMGIPNYGYDWTLPHVPGQSVAQSIGNVAAVEQAVNRGASIAFDETAQSPFYNYYRDRVEHEVWFEDARSIESKLALAHEFHLHGISVWNIMRYFPQLWLVLNDQYIIQKQD